MDLPAVTGFADYFIKTFAAEAQSSAFGHPEKADLTDGIALAKRMVRKVRAGRNGSNRPFL